MPLSLPFCFSLFLCTGVPVVPGVPGDSDGIHLSPPPAQRGRNKKGKKCPNFSSNNGLCNNHTEEDTLTSRQTTSNHITPLVRHIIPGITTCYTWYCCTVLWLAAWLYTAWSCAWQAYNTYMHVLVVQRIPSYDPGRHSMM